MYMVVVTSLLFSLLIMYCYVYCCVGLCFFFFKQKTAYEMRISDWSSDVCSSDLEFSVDETKIKGGVVRDERRIAEEFDQLVDARREQGLVRQKMDRQAVYRFGGGGDVAFGIEISGGVDAVFAADDQPHTSDFDQPVPAPGDETRGYGSVTKHAQSSLK